MLIIMHYGYVLQPPFNFEISGALMSSKFIPKVGQSFNCLNEFVDILNIYFYIKTSISARFKQQRFTFITGFCLKLQDQYLQAPKLPVPFVITAT
jgi:hypothetical protein